MKKAKREALMIAPDRLALGIEPNSSLSVLDMMECAQLAENKGFAATWVAEGRFLRC